MVRQGYRFKKAAYEEVEAPSFEDTPNALEMKWRKWVEEESFKRYVHQRRNTQFGSGILLNTRGLIAGL